MCHVSGVHLCGTMPVEVLELSSTFSVAPELSAYFNGGWSFIPAAWQLQAWRWHCSPAALGTCIAQQLLQPRDLQARSRHMGGMSARLSSGRCPWHLLPSTKCASQASPHPIKHERGCFGSGAQAQGALPQSAGCPQVHRDRLPGLSRMRVAQAFNPEKPSLPPLERRTLRCARPEEGEQSSPAAGAWVRYLVLRVEGLGRGLNLRPRYWSHWCRSSGAPPAELVLEAVLLQAPGAASGSARKSRSPDAQQLGSSLSSRVGTAEGQSQMQMGACQAACMGVQLMCGYQLPRLAPVQLQLGEQGWIFP